MDLNFVRRVATRILTGAVILSATPLFAQTAQTIDSNATTLRGGSYADRNLSASPTLETRVGGDESYTRRVALKFDATTLVPSDATITSATVTLTVAPGSNGETRTLAAYRLVSTFDETEATWRSSRNTIPWGAPGGDLAESYSTATVTGVAGSQVSLDVTNLVRYATTGFFGTPRTTHIAIIDVGGPSKEGYKQYYSDEATPYSLRPLLTVTYARAGTSSTSTSTTSPAPTSTSTTSTVTSGIAGEIVVPVASTAARSGAWQVVSDPTAATGSRVWNPNRGAAKLAQPSAWPTDYFDVRFDAEAGRGYRLWIRGRAENDGWANDSVFVQFSSSVNAAGAPVFRMGTPSATTVSIENGSGQGLAAWGWSDNGWDSLGDLIYFETTGPQTLRIQRREDGVSIDQIVLSSSTYMSAAPGLAKNDNTLLVGAATTTTTTSTTTTTPTTTTSTSTTTTAPPTTVSNGTPVRLRVLDWNVYHGMGTDGVYNLDRIATWIASANPDVVLLNEVERNTYWGREDQPERYRALLEAKTGRRWYSHFAQEFGAWSSAGKGHQILSVYPFDSVSYTTITQSSGLNWAGAASQAAITVNGRTINFILSHLDPYDRDMRLTQARDVIRWASGFAENRILAGDMNAWPDQTSIAEINQTYYDAWTVAANRGTATGIPGITPFGATKNGRIDYIFFSRNAPNLVVLDARTIDTRDANGYMASDHRPVVVNFEVR